MAKNVSKCQKYQNIYSLCGYLLQIAQITQIRGYIALMTLIRKAVEKKNPLQSFSICVGKEYIPYNLKQN